MQGISQWTGVEVEGRLSGLRTLFLRGIPEDNRQLVDMPHVFIDHEMDFTDPRWPVFRDYLATSYTGLVTLSVLQDELGEAPGVYGYALLNKAHIMVVVELPAIPYLKPTDTIKVTTAPYLCRSFVWDCGQRTEPQHYAQDVRHSA